MPFYPSNNSYDFIRAPSKKPQRRFVPLCQPRCRVERGERGEVECERGESRETKAKIGSRVLKLQPLSGRDVSMAVSRRPGEKEREGRRRGERWTDRCLEAILVSSCAFRMSASKVERVLCARKAAHPTKFMSRKIRA